MTPRQEKFCLEYARTGNATEAYKLAGYRCNNANTLKSNAARLASNADVQKRLQEIAAEFATAKIADIEECQALLTAIARDENQKGLARVQALNTLLKVQGAFAAQVNLNAPLPQVVITGADELED